MIEINNYLSKLRAKVSELNVEETFKKQSSGGILIDIREKDESDVESPIGAHRISKGLLEMQINKIVPHTEQEILLICASGKRSLVSAFSLSQMGYKNVYSVNGGFKEWKNKKLPFEKPRTLSPEDFIRYKRHLLIPEVGEQGQLKLLDSKVLIIGAGGIGSPVAWYLAAAGVGHIGIVDDDIVDLTNLQRQILHTEESVGNSKVESAKQRLGALNSGIEVKTYNARLNPSNVEKIMQGYDLVLDGTDNFTTRYLINDACVKLKIPNVHGSVFRFEGQVSTFWPAAQQENAPCYRCAYPSPPPPELAPSCAEAGVLGVLPGLVGVMCATEAIKLLIGAGKLLLGKLICINALNWDLDIYELDANENCVYCKCKSSSEYPKYETYSESCVI